MINSTFKNSNYIFNHSKYTFFLEIKGFLTVIGKGTGKIDGLQYFKILISFIFSKVTTKRQFIHGFKNMFYSRTLIYSARTHSSQNNK